MKYIILPVIVVLLLTHTAYADDWQVWELIDETGAHLTHICYEPNEGDEYLSADNLMYRVIKVEEARATVAAIGTQSMPSLEWMDDAKPVSAKNRVIGLYCTHSDESYQPSDGFYSTQDRGTIYQVAQHLSEAMQEEGIEAQVNDTLHHPHDAGAYRRSRQTAIELLRTTFPDCLIDVHRDGIPDPASYETEIAGKKASKIRLLVGRGNQNAELNKEFALTIKAVADRVYPGLIKDIYMGKGAFNQDLLPRSILFECGTYTIDKELVLTSMPMMADVINRALYGGLIGSVGEIHRDVPMQQGTNGGITQGQPDPTPAHEPSGISSGVTFLLMILIVGVGGIALLSTGSIRDGKRKLRRNISEMTGGLIGQAPEKDEDHDHS